jgi:hypothetical protein
MAVAVVTAGAGAAVMAEEVEATPAVVVVAATLRRGISAA